MTGTVSDADLHAYIDGELPPERVADVAAAIARDPELMLRERDFRADKRAMMAAFDHLAALPMPPGLLAAARFGPTRHRRRALVFAGAAALAASLLLTLGPRTPKEPAIEQALAARIQARMPSRELDGHAPATLEAANQAMSNLLGNPARVPDLQRAGFSLVEADLYDGPPSDSVQLRYQDAQRRLFTVFLRRSAGPDAFEVTERGKVRLCLWQNADLTAVMTGEMSTPELFRLASLTYSSLGL
jgi:anti-sigma factor RsiW